MGEQVTHGGLMNLLLGATPQSIGGAELQKDLMHLSARDADTAARRLQSITSQIEPLSQVIREEQSTEEAMLLLTMRGGQWRSFHRDEGESFSQSVGEWLTNQRWSEKQIFNQNVRYLNSIVALYRRPYPLRKPMPGVPSDLFASDMGPVISESNVAYARLLTSNELLIGKLALHAYDLDHHRFPDRLSQLVPQYLRKIPIDPFTVNAPLRYHRSGAGYILYSLGPDGNDDNGRPIPKRIADGTRAAIDANSKGDIAITGQ